MNLLKIFTRNQTHESLGVLNYLERIPDNPQAEQIFRNFLVKRGSVENLDAFMTLKKQMSSSPIFRHDFFRTFFRPGAPQELNMFKAPVSPAQLDKEMFDRIEIDILRNLAESWGHFDITAEGKRAMQLLATTPPRNR